MMSLGEMKRLFESANSDFLSIDKELFLNRVSERTLCGRLMLHLYNKMMQNESLSNYYVDVEYNRNKRGIKTIIKTIKGPEDKIIRINCDLIIHSRNKNYFQDNLIALEMKKTERKKADKQADKDRLKALTKKSFDDIGSVDEGTRPKHVCGYMLGIYYEVNLRKNKIFVEYYSEGEFLSNAVIPIK